MTGVAYDPERSVWLVILDGHVRGLCASSAAAMLALRDLADEGKV